MGCEPPQIVNGTSRVTLNSTNATYLQGHHLTQETAGVVAEVYPNQECEKKDTLNKERIDKINSNAGNVISTSSNSGCASAEVGQLEMNYVDTLPSSADSQASGEIFLL